MTPPEFWIIAGPNGAGKTTCAQKAPISQLLPDVRFLNPDDLTLTKLRTAGYHSFADSPLDIQSQFFIESADEVLTEVNAAIARSEAVGVETVLSSGKYQAPVETVRSVGGFVGLIYVALKSALIARERVAARVLRGGHGVPDEKVDQRWQRSLACLAWFAKRSSAFWIIDNSDSNPANPPELVASGKNGVIESAAANVFPEMQAALAEITK
jgi:predicted ABC-type ATPase